MKNRRLTIVAAALLALASLLAMGALFEQQTSIRELTIAAEVDTSTVLHVQPWAHYFGFCTDADFDGATLSFEVAQSGFEEADFSALLDPSDGMAWTMTLGASQCGAVGGDVADALVPWPYMRVVSSLAQAAATPSVVTVTMKR